MEHVAVFLLVIAQIPAVSRAVWRNTFDNPLFFACPSNQVLNYVRSEHHNLYEDRRFELNCRPEEGQRFCSWSGYVNDYRDLMVFQCSDGGFINGMHSNHRNGNIEDRKWIFYCCRKPDYHTANCFYTAWLNAYDDPFTLNVAHSNYIRGLVSPYSLFHKDRKFLFEICSLRRNFPPPQQGTLSSIPYHHRGHYRFRTTTTGDIISDSPPPQQETLSSIPYHHNRGHYRFPTTTTGDIISDSPPPQQGTLSSIPYHHNRGHYRFPTTTTGDIISDSPPSQQGTLSSARQSDDG